MGCCDWPSGAPLPGEQRFKRVWFPHPRQKNRRDAVALCHAQHGFAPDLLVEVFAGFLLCHAVQGLRWSRSVHPLGARAQIDQSRFSRSMNARLMKIFSRPILYSRKMPIAVSSLR